MISLRFLLSFANKVLKGPLFPLDAIMTFHNIRQIAEQPARADKSAVAAINRALLVWE